MLFLFSSSPQTVFPGSASLCVCPSGCQSSCISPAFSFSMLVPVFVLSAFRSYGFFLFLAKHGRANHQEHIKNSCLLPIRSAACLPLLSMLPAHTANSLQLWQVTIRQRDQLCLHISMLEVSCSASQRG